MTPKIPAPQRTVAAIRSRVRAFRQPDDDTETPTPHGLMPRARALEDRVAALEEAVEENRRLNQRLADVVDVVTEVLVPAVDRDDERLRAALSRLNQTLGDKRG